MPSPDRSAYPDRFYPVVDSVKWVARLTALGVGTIQLRAKDLNDSEALQIVSDALAITKGTPTKLVVNDYWRAAIVAGAAHLHLGQEDLVDADVKAIRRSLRMSQDEFAAVYRIPLATLKNWEQGRRQPDAPAIAYLRAIQRRPREVMEALST